MTPSGFRRMREQMLNHGLEQPLFGTDTGYFKVSFPGPGDNLDRLRVPVGIGTGLLPAQEERLNVRQLTILEDAVLQQSVTSGWCRKTFDVSYDTANRDLLEMVDLGLLRREGKGRGTRFVPVTEREQAL